MERLLRKFRRARTLVPAPVIEATGTSDIGLVAIGSSRGAVNEARDILAKRGIPVALGTVFGILLVEASDDPGMIGHRFEMTQSPVTLGRSADSRACADAGEHLARSDSVILL